MAINISDFDKIWASTSPLTPYAFSDNNYKQGWNFVGATPPARQMWDSYMKFSDEKQQFLCDSIFAGNPLTLTADDGNGNTASLIGNPNGSITWNGNTIPTKNVNIQTGKTASTTVPAGDGVAIPITFSPAFSSNPVVLATVQTNYRGFYASVGSVTTSGASISLNNTSATERSVVVGWMAISI